MFFSLRFSLTIFLVGLAIIAQGQTFKFEAGTPSQTANVFGNQQARHNQQIYLPGDIMDSTLAPVTISKLYFKLATLSTNANPVDTLTISLGATNIRTFKTVFSPKYGSIFISKSKLTQVYQKANDTLPGGAENAWVSILLDVPYTYEPSKVLCMDIRYTGTSTNYTYSVYGMGRFTPGVYPRVAVNNLIDTIGSNSSSTLPYLGIDVITAVKPVKTLQVKTFPNPATSQLEISLPNPTGASATLISADGRKVALGTRSGWDKWALPAGLAPGLYTLLAEQAGMHYRAQVVVQ